MRFSLKLISFDKIRKDLLQYESVHTHSHHTPDSKNKPRSNRSMKCILHRFIQRPLFSTFTILQYMIHNYTLSSAFQL